MTNSCSSIMKEFISELLCPVLNTLLKTLQDQSLKFQPEYKRYVYIYINNICLYFINKYIT